VVSPLHPAIASTTPTSAARDRRDVELRKVELREIGERGVDERATG
jgi:hypothetical protein